MDEKKLLENFAKFLKVEDVLELKEQKKLKEQRMLDKLNQSLAKLVGENEQHAQIIEQEVSETIEALHQPEPIVEEIEPVAEEPVIVEEAGRQPMPELPTKNIINRSVEVISQAPQKKIQKAVDALPDGLRKELDVIKKSITDLHSLASRMSQMGGGGEVWFRWLDDVNRSTMGTGNDNWVLEYDAATKKVQFTEDIGAIRTILFNQNGPSQPLVAGQMGWNTAEDCLDIRQKDGTTVQVGLENYIQVRNTTGNTVTNGTVVRFAGAFVDDDYVPTIEPHIADGTIPPLYTIGVVTENIPNNTTGRVTVLGKVRDINTTGSDVGETWNVGDILYVSPTNPGKMTKVKPTAPNIVVSVAAVLKKDATTGILLVRPTIFPRLHYGVFSDRARNQTAAAINTPYKVKYNTTEIASGHVIQNDVDGNPSRIVALNSGLYNYQFSIQFVSTNAAAKNVWIWFRKNGTDIAHSATRISVTGNGVYFVAAWNFVVSMNANDYFQMIWATSDTSVSISSPAATSFAPETPGVVLTVTEAAL